MELLNFYIEKNIIKQYKFYNINVVSTVNRNEMVGWTCRSWSENLRS